MFSTKSNKHEYVTSTGTAGVRGAANASSFAAAAGVVDPEALVDFGGVWVTQQEYDDTIADLWDLFQQQSSSEPEQLGRGR